MEIVALEVDIVGRMPLSLEIHDAIICAPAMLFADAMGKGVAVLTVDEDIQKSRVVKTVW